MDRLSNSSLSELSLAQKRALLAEMLQKKAAEPKSFPLSFAQQGLWFLDQLAPDNAFYNASCEIAMSGPLRQTALEQSLSELVRRHQTLRTRFELVDGQPVQVIDPAQAVSLPIADLSSLSIAASLAEAQCLTRQEVRQPFDLARGPLLRVRLLRLGPEEHRLLLSLHHIIADGWSLGILFSELSALYAAFHEEQPSPLADLPMQYRDFALWQRQWFTGAAMQKQLTYWKEQLADLPQLALPTDRPRPAAQTFVGATEPFSLAPETTSRLQALSRREGVTLFMTLLAGFSVLLARYSAQEDIAVGTPIAHRTRSELEGLIGYFVNTLVLRTDLSGDPTVRTLLHRVREVALSAYAQQDVPFERLVEELHPQRDLGQNPLFQVMLALQNPYEPLDIAGLKLRLSQAQSDTSKFDLFLSLWENAGRLSGTLEYSTHVFDASTMRRLLEHYRQVLTAMAEHPEQRLSLLPLLTDVEREQFQAWNATSMEYPHDIHLHQLFEQQAQRHPDAIALIYQAEYITYGELNARANRVAHFLRRLDVGPDTPVGLCLERSLDMLIGLLGILKAGAAYVPLDPDYPIERLAFMLQHAQAPVLLAQQRLLESLPIQAISLVCLDTDWPLIAAQSAENPDIPLHAQNLATATAGLAYIIYTSGSTGQPKGIAMPHAALVNLFRWQQRSSALPLGARTLQFASLSFDVATQEIFSTLGFGQTLVLLSEDLRRDPAELLTLLAYEAIERLFLPVVALQQLAESVMSGAAQHPPTALRAVITAGEQLQITPAVTHLFANLSTTLLCNEYGPSESHVVSSYLLAGNPSVWPALPPIGCPIDNTELYVLDKHMQRVPIGVPGELYIGGAGLARGYLSRPDLTAERFVPHAYSDLPGARLYKTGDLARYRLDGSLDFLGRIDHQVKIRGFRVEPGEIEAVLRRHPGVQHAVVLAREDTAGEKRLVAYVVTSPSTAAPNGTHLRQYLHTHLPDYMLPAHFVLLDALPITANGKLDRRALPAPDLLHNSSNELAATSATPLEAVLLAIWSTVLGNAHVGLHDNFFELGGHSLLATQVMARIRTSLHVDIPLRMLFESPSIDQLAPRVAAARWAELRGQQLPLRPASRDAHTLLPLSFAQQRLWFLDQLAPASSFYILSGFWRLEGDLHVAALLHSLNMLVQRHETLRTRIVAANGQPAQVIDPPSSIHFPLIDLTALSSVESQQQAQRLAHAQAHHPFDLSHAPLLHACLLRLSRQEHWLLLSLHHIITDGWSMPILLRELATCYHAALHHESPALPTDHPRPAVQSFHGATHPFTVSSGLTHALTDLSRREGVTLFMTLLAAFAVLLARCSGQDDLLIGTPIANRTHEALEDLLGFFVNMLVLRVDLSDTPSFQQLLARVREVALDAYAHQDLPFEQLVDALHLERDLSRNPLFQVTCQLQNATTESVDLPGVQTTALDAGSDITRFDLSLFLAEEASGLSGLLEYNTDLFEQATIEGLLAQYQCLLAGIVAQPRQRICWLPLLTSAERQQLLVAWNATAASFPQDTCVHTLFEAQVERTPDAIAVLLAAHHLTYRELNARANQLAQYLQHLEVGPDTLVGLCLEPSLEMVIGVLGILKAGAAYVPLDPSYPPQRLAFMLEDARLSLLLTRRHMASRLRLIEYESRIVSLDHDWPTIARESASNVTSSVQPASLATATARLAYVIYTSGSTGQPKGVMITHRGLTNYLSWCVTAFDVARGCGSLLHSSLSFDLTVTGLFAPLLVGQSVNLLPEARDIDALASALRQSRNSSLLKLTPSHLALLAQQLALEDITDCTHTFILGGEALLREDYRLLAGTRASHAPDQ